MGPGAGRVALMSLLKVAGEIAEPVPEQHQAAERRAGHQAVLAHREPRAPNR